ncbi:hypothetical protein [Pontibacter ruber]|uniref:Uncharacterized protein n=1 Tax=Pontibacter ruber TaxID=1343895 RepID=A0ABW5D0R0_9BACT|nr:hypothetical protein [Pontibacter ruber]
MKKIYLLFILLLQLATTGEDKGTVYPTIRVTDNWTLEWNEPYTLSQDRTVATTHCLKRSSIL